MNKAVRHFILGLSLFAVHVASASTFEIIEHKNCNEIVTKSLRDSDDSTGWSFYHSGGSFTLQNSVIRPLVSNQPFTISLGDDASQVATVKLDGKVFDAATPELQTAFGLELALLNSRDSKANSLGKLIFFTSNAQGWNVGDSNDPQDRRQHLLFTMIYLGGADLPGDAAVSCRYIEKDLAAEMLNRNSTCIWIDTTTTASNGKPYCTNQF